MWSNNNMISKSFFNICISKLKCFPTITTFSDSKKPSNILNNFNSLYDESNCYSDELYFSDSSSVPDFASAFASHRFFVSSPGRSNSIFEAPPEEECSGAAVSGGVAVQKKSPDPYTDFRRSMVEMIEARGGDNEAADWEFLDELLLCYVGLNSKHTHKFIFSAFADVIVSLVLPRHLH